MFNAFFKLLSAGFAMFAMFFGSGNLVFPLKVGVFTSGTPLYGSLGIFVTGVLVPFLGCLALILHQGKWQLFFGCLGKKMQTLLPFILLMILGPFGVCARCITVAHGGMRPLFPSLPLGLFSALFCWGLYLALSSKSRLVSLIGSYLTPLLLLCLGILAYFGLSQEAALASPPPDSYKAFNLGFLEGYQTMDLLAAFFFSSYILQHLNQSMKGKKLAFSALIFPCVIGMALLTLVYTLLVLLGNHHALHLTQSPPQSLLALIALRALGPQGMWVFSLTVLLACYTTAVVLMSLFVAFVKKEILRDAFSHSYLLFLSLVVCFFTSYLDFEGIALLLAPILDVLYPALIVLTLFSLLHHATGIKMQKWPFYLTCLIKLTLPFFPF